MRKKNQKKATCHPDAPYFALGFCSKCYGKNFYKKDKKAAEKARKRKKEWIKNNPEKNKINEKKRHLNKKFGITIDSFNKLMDSQDGKCAICRNAESVKSRGRKVNDLAVDHCHKTALIRGLLCFRCNTTIAHIERNDGIIDKINEYLGLKK